MNRDENVMPNVWYTVGGLRAIIRHNRKWYIHFYPKKMVPGEKPIVSYVWDSKADILSQTNAHFMRSNRRKCRFRKIKEIPTTAKVVAPKAPKKEPKKVYNVDETMEKHVEDFTKRRFEFLWDLTEYLIQLKKTCRVGFICTQLMIIILLFVIIFG